MAHWKITVEVWPHSTGEGAEIDQAACGPRTQCRDVKADDIGEAIEKAILFAAGVCTNPRVWQAPIRTVSHIPHT